MKKTAVMSVVFSPILLFAEIVLESPADNETLVLLPQNQKELLAIPSHAERIRILSADKAKGKDSHYFAKELIWQSPMPIHFRWKCTAGEKGVFLIQLSDDPDFKNCKMFNSYRRYIHPDWSSLNFKLGHKYYWRVMTRDKKSISKTFSFVTESQPPRWIKIGGRAKNIRDLGGWKTADGKTVRQGMLFRGAELNDTSYDRVAAGRNCLMIEDINLLCNELGIKTDLDLRSFGETAGMKGSPIGPQVKLIQIPTPAYTGIHTKNGKAIMAKAFKVLAAPANLPCYFHCAGGWDRTGALAFIANGLLGVPENQLALDWELTTLPYIPDMPPQPDPLRNYGGMVKGFDRHGTSRDSLSQKIENYLLDGGVTPAEIARFKKAMLEE